MDAFRALLRSRLQRRGDLQRLADASGLNNSVISRWMTAGIRPDPANLEKIAPALGVAYDELLRMCGYLPTADADSPTDALSESRRQREIAHQQVEEWIAAVGEQYLPLLLDSWRSDAHNIIRFRDIQGAVMPPQDTAVIPPVRRTRRGPTHRRGSGETPLDLHQHQGRSLLGRRVAT